MSLIFKINIKLFFLLIIFSLLLYTACITSTDDDDNKSKPTSSLTQSSLQSLSSSNLSESLSSILTSSLISTPSSAPVSSSQNSSISSSSSSLPIITLTYQAEDACSIVNGATESQHTGYTGSGYVNTENAADQYIQWNIDLTSPASCNIAFTYANGGSNNRTALLEINGTTTVSQIDFTIDSVWTSWHETSSLTVTLQNGLNTIKLISTQAEGLANIDKMTITGPASTQACSNSSITSSSSLSDSSLTSSQDTSTFSSISTSSSASSLTYAASFANWVMTNWPDPADLPKQRWEYTAGIVLQGMMNVYESTGNNTYLNYIQSWLDTFIDNSGDINWETSTYNLDLLQPGILLFKVYEETGLAKYQTAATTIKDRFDSIPTNAEGGFWHKSSYPDEMWLDGIYMAEPFITRYGHDFADATSCYETATFQTLLIAGHALNSADNLLYHGWDQDKNASWADSTTGLSPEYWSRAMGWYIMALVDILEFLPSTHKDYNSLVTLLQDAAAGLALVQDETTGLWYQVLDKGDQNDNWLESSGSGMFVYALKKALDLGLIDSSYNTVAEAGWNGLITHMITWDSAAEPVINGAVVGMGVQTSYANYVNKSTASNSPHGLCAVMLAASRMEY